MPGTWREPASPSTVCAVGSQAGPGEREFAADRQPIPERSQLVEPRDDSLDACCIDRGDGRRRVPEARVGPLLVTPAPRQIAQGGEALGQIELLFVGRFTAQ